MEYGFYVVMGGLVVDIRDVKGSYATVPKATLTSYGVIELAKQRHFFDIPPETLLDKSKASISGKTLVCIQILWMVVQCIARKATGYPLTLLEIHTMVHVVCALGMYVFWFSVSYWFLDYLGLWSELH